ncbi:hypothetical protein OAA15_00690 [bacterium]|nr:hypothetical protein [bacterium]
MSKLNFDEWYEIHEEEINIELAESGADRELGFDAELEFEYRYTKYLNSLDENKAYDAVGNVVYFEMVNGFWYKWEYDNKRNKTRHEDKNGFWWVAEYNEYNHQVYYEDIHGCVIGFREGQEHIKVVNKNKNNAQGWSPFAK